MFLPGFGRLRRWRPQCGKDQPDQPIQNENRQFLPHPYQEIDVDGDEVGGDTVLVAHPARLSSPCKHWTGMRHPWHCASTTVLSKGSESAISKHRQHRWWFRWPSKANYPPAVWVSVARSSCKHWVDVYLWDLGEAFCYHYGAERMKGNGPARSIDGIEGETFEGP